MKNMNELPFNLFLIGFMGTGKSALASCLHRQYHMELVEMDEKIAEQEGMSIPEIFEQKGEPYFRDAETALLRALGTKKGAVVSCGGGVPLRECNVEAMRQSGKIVLLTASPKTVKKRVSGNRNRPLLRNRESVESIRELMEERRPRYEQAADLVIATDGKTVEEICGELIRRLQDEK